jgi:hypothetical protein
MTVQKLVYYVSEVLHEAKARYSEMHKILYAIFIAPRKLRHYFQAYKIVVVTSYLLRAILHNANAMGNIAKWAAELTGFQLNFQPCHSIKSQVLADFVAEWTPTPSVPRGPDHGSDPPPTSRRQGSGVHRTPLDALLRWVRMQQEGWSWHSPHRPKWRTSEVYGAPRL